MRKNRKTGAEKAVDDVGEESWLELMKGLDKKSATMEIKNVDGKPSSGCRRISRHIRLVKREDGNFGSPKLCRLTYYVKGKKR